MADQFDDDSDLDAFFGASEAQPVTAETGRMAAAVYAPGSKQSIQDKSLARVMSKAEQNPNAMVGGRSAKERMESIRHNTNAGDEFGVAPEGTAGQAYIRKAGEVLADTGLNIADIATSLNSPFGRSPYKQQLKTTGKKLAEYSAPTTKAHPYASAAGMVTGYALPAAITGPMAGETMASQLGADAFATWLGSNPDEKAWIRLLEAAGGAAGGQVIRKYLPPAVANSKLAQAAIGKAKGGLSKLYGYLPDVFKTDLFPPKAVAQAPKTFPDLPYREGEPTGAPPGWGEPGPEPGSEAYYADMNRGMENVVNELDYPIGPAEEMIPGGSRPGLNETTRSTGAGPVSPMVNEPAPFSEVKPGWINLEQLDKSPGGQQPLSSLDNTSNKLKSALEAGKAARTAELADYEPHKTDLLKDIDPAFQDKAAAEIDKWLPKIKDAKDPAGQIEAARTLHKNLEKFKAAPKLPGGRGETAEVHGPKTQEETAFKHSADLSKQRREIHPVASEVPAAVREHSLDKSMDELAKGLESGIGAKKFEKKVTPKLLKEEPDVYTTQPIKKSKTTKAPKGMKASEIEGKPKTVYPKPDVGKRPLEIRRPGSIPLSPEPHPELAKYSSSLTADDMVDGINMGEEAISQGYKDFGSWSSNMRARPQGDRFSNENLREIWKKMTGKDPALPERRELGTRSGEIPSAEAKAAGDKAWEEFQEYSKRRQRKE